MLAQALVLCEQLRMVKILRRCDLHMCGLSLLIVFLPLLPLLHLGGFMLCFELVALLQIIVPRFVQLFVVGGSLGRHGFGYVFLELRAESVLSGLILALYSGAAFLWGVCRLE